MKGASPLATDTQLARRALDSSFEDGGVRSPLAGLFPKSLPVPSLAQALAGIGQQFPDLAPEGKCVKIARKHAKTIDPVHTRGMREDEILTLILYTMEAVPREESLYFLMNAALRSKDRSGVREWRDYIWLLLHAMRQIEQPTERNVYRGFRIETGFFTTKPNLSKGADVTWSAFSSTASTVDVMSSFLGQEGERIMYNIELTEPIARDIKPFSLFPSENELLLPPGFSFEIVATFEAGGGLTMVQCKQTETLDVLLDFGAPPSTWNVPISRPAQTGVPPQAQAQSAQQAEQIRMMQQMQEQMQQMQQQQQQQMQQQQQPAQPKGILKNQPQRAPQLQLMGRDIEGGIDGVWDYVTSSGKYTGITAWGQAITIRGKQAYMQGTVESVDEANKLVVAKSLTDGKVYNIDLLAPLAPPDRKRKEPPRRLLQRSPIVSPFPTDLDDN